MLKTIQRFPLIMDHLLYKRRLSFILLTHFSLRCQRKKRSLEKWQKFPLQFTTFPTVGGTSMKIIPARDPSYMTCPALVGSRSYKNKILEYLYNGEEKEQNKTFFSCHFEWVFVSRVKTNHADSSTYGNQLRGSTKFHSFFQLNEENIYGT